jgi:hypothetical protein
VSEATVWRALLRPGDYLIFIAGAALVAVSAQWAWQGERGGERAVVRVDGRIFSEVDLAASKTLTVNGPRGPSVIRIEAGRARVVSDPGPRQYCVRQGWLARAGDIAICAPNRVSLQIVGRGAGPDSVVY